jgi:hypothetical protein
MLIGAGLSLIVLVIALTSIIKKKEEINHLPKAIICSFISIFILMIFANFQVHPYVTQSHYDKVTRYEIPRTYILYGGSSEMADREHVYAQDWSTGNVVNDLHNVFWSNKSVNNSRSNMKYGLPSEAGVFTPQDEYKGDVARALLYMYVTYRTNRDFNVHYIDLPLMKQWCMLDFPDSREIQRNNMISTIQGNRNMFIDSPFLCLLVF